MTSLPGSRAWRPRTGRLRSSQPRSARSPGLILGALGVASSLLAVSGPVSARERGFCYLPFPFEYDAVHRPCGRDRQVACETGRPCDAGYRPLYLSQGGYPEVPVACVASTDVISAVCATCGVENEIACEMPAPCADGLRHVTTDNLDGPISACRALLPEDEEDFTFTLPAINDPILGWELFPETSVPVPLPTSVQFVNAFGTCSDGHPEELSGASRESWPAEEPVSDERGTVVFVHGRGADCAGKDSLLRGSESPLFERNHRMYCFQYDGAPGEPERRLVQLLEPREESPVPCAAQDACSWNTDEPVIELAAESHSVPGVAAAMAEALAQVPIEGELTILGHSQGGFIVRALLHRHYDELRWAGKKVSRVVFLAHPFYGKVVDPSKVTPWLCASRDDFDCAVQRWLWGWQNWLGTSSGNIDDSDFPQLEWSVIAGDGLNQAGTGPGPVEEEVEGHACLRIFGGVDGATLEGDTSVPIQSSLGFDEHGFYAVSELSFDDRVQARCTHGADCSIRAALSSDPDRLPAVSAPDAGASALDFDGVDDVLSGLSAEALQGLTMSDALTLEAWIWPARAGQGAVIVNKEGEYEIGLLEGELSWALSLDEPAWIWQRAGFFPPPRQWTHVALVYEEAEAAVWVYVDGVEVARTPVTGRIGDVLPEDDFRIGGRESTEQPFAGRIAELRVWASARTAEQIRDGAGGGTIDLDNADLRGWWTFDGESDETARDLSSEERDLSLLPSGAGPVRRAEDRLRRGGALYFDGVDDRATVTDAETLAALEMSEALTIEAWLHPRGPGGSGGGVILNKEGEYALTRLGDGTIAFSLAGTDLGWVTVPTEVQAPERVWTHVALAYADDGRGVLVYENGELEQVIVANGKIGDFHPDANQLWLGGRQETGNEQWFHGVLDQVRLWHVRRTSPEIEEHFEHPLPTNAREGLSAIWRFDEMSGSLLLDSSGAARHAGLGLFGEPTTPIRSFAPALPGYPSSLLEPDPTEPVGMAGGAGMGAGGASGASGEGGDDEPGGGGGGMSSGGSGSQQAPAAADDDPPGASGCGCRTTPSEPTLPPLLLLSIALSLLGRRRTSRAREARRAQRASS